MVNSQRGVSILEAIAYLAIYGVIAVGVLSGASAILGEVAEKKDMAAVVQLEKDIRGVGVVLNGYNPVNTDNSLDGGAADLKTFLQNRGIKNSSTLPSGKTVDFSPAGTVVSGSCTVAYSFSINVGSLSRTECADYWNYPWPSTLALMQTTVSSNAKYNMNTSCQIEQTDPDFCESGKNFVLYFK